MEETRKFSRKDLLKTGAITGASLALSPATNVLESILPPPERQMSIQEVLNRFPDINPAITAVNFSYVPDSIKGKYSHLHSSQESLFIAVPYDDIDKGKIEIYGLTEGLKEANNRGQEVFYIIELPRSPSEYNRSSWQKKLKNVCQTFPNAYCFIMGNELNADYSSWYSHLQEYLDLYLTSYQTIKELNPNTKIFPWQEAYFGNGEMLRDFLLYLKVKGGKIDGLPINIYDISSKILERIRLYQNLLKEYYFPNTPIVISELGQPLKSPFPLTEPQKADLVIQHLALAAFFHQEGLIEQAAWFCAFNGHEDLQKFSLTAAEPKEFILKQGFFPFVFCQHALTGKISFDKDVNGLVRFFVKEKGQLKIVLAWNDGKNIVKVPSMSAKTILTSTGRQTNEKNVIELQPSVNPELLPGETRILLF